MKTQHPVHIMMFGVVTIYGHVMPLFIFTYGLRLNMEDLHQMPGGSSTARDERKTLHQATGLYAINRTKLCACAGLINLK